MTDTSPPFKQVAEDCPPPASMSAQGVERKFGSTMVVTGRDVRPRAGSALWVGVLLLWAVSVAAEPPVPSWLTAESRAGYILVSWKPVTTASGYRVYRSMSSGGPYVELGRIAGRESTSYSDSEVTNGTKYFYVIRSYDSTWKESASSSQAVAVADTEIPGATITSLRTMDHFSGKGPTAIAGEAVDAASGVSTVNIAIRRNDTKEWWAGAYWEKMDTPAYLETRLGKGRPSVTWGYDAGSVIWSQAASYLLMVRVADRAGYTLDPAASSTIYVDTPAILTMSMAAAPSVVTVGQEVLVTVMFVNTGGTEASNIIPEVPEWAGSARFARVGESAGERISSLAPGEIATVSWKFSAVMPGTVRFQAGGRAENTPTGESVRAEPAASNDVMVRTPARLSVSVTPTPANVRRGADFAVRMRVTNVGEATARVTRVGLVAVKPELVAGIQGPRPVPPFSLDGGETKELIWTASAAGAGEVAFKGQATGVDETSGAEADAVPFVSVPVGMASSPAMIHMASAVGSAEVKSVVGLTAILRDETGVPVPGAEVAFDVLVGGGKLEAGSAITDEYGRARVNMKLGEKSGISTVQGRCGAVLGGITVEAVLPGEMGQYLSRNYFDPSREQTVDVVVFLPRAEKVRVRVLSRTGETVRTLADGKAKAGNTTFTWDGKDDDGNGVRNGVYLFWVQTGSKLQTRRVSVLRRLSTESSGGGSAP